jgi:hypothetical protein
VQFQLGEEVKINGNLNDRWIVREVTKLEKYSCFESEYKYKLQSKYRPCDYKIEFDFL